ncbi:MAG: hypothetical protein ACYCSH_06335 [Acidithiobacillus sp.]
MKKYQIEVDAPDSDSVEAIHECFWCARVQPDEGANLQEALAKIDWINRAERLVFPSGFILDQEECRSLGTPDQPLNFPLESILSSSTYSESAFVPGLDEHWEILEKVVSTLEEINPPGVTIRRVD